jgi:hypothetical protein
MTTKLIDIHDPENTKKLLALGELATTAWEAGLKMVVALAELEERAAHLRDEVGKYSHEDHEETMRGAKGRAWMLADLALNDCRNLLAPATAAHMRIDVLEHMAETLRELLPKM